MKKMIRDRSIFAVVAAVIMAAVMLFCSAQPPVPHLSAECRAVLGQEADTSVSRFLSDMQEWHASYTPEEEGVLLTLENDYAAIVDVLMTALDFVTAYNEASLGPDMMLVAEECADIQNLILNSLVIILTLESSGFFAISAEDWAGLGSDIDAAVTSRVIA